MHVLVLGGIRSGKSMLAEEAARRLEEQAQLPVTYLATARASDGEMAERIRQHRLRRPSRWRTVEAGGDPEQLVLAAERLQGEGGILLLDCLSLWVAATLDSDEGETVFARRLERLQEAVLGAEHAIVVSVEAGLGLVPMEPLSRQFLDRLGDANQAFAKACDRVMLSLAGLPMTLKGDGRP